MSKAVVIVDPREACASLASRMNKLCYADAMLSTLSGDESIPQNLVAELYPLDYRLMVQAFTTVLRNPAAVVQHKRFKSQYREAMRIMRGLDYSWASPQGFWQSPSEHFNLPRDVTLTLYGQMTGALSELFGKAELFSELGVKNHAEAMSQLQFDGSTFVNFLMNVAAGDAYGVRCAEMGKANPYDMFGESLLWLEKFFTRVLTVPRNAGGLTLSLSAGSAA